MTRPFLLLQLVLIFSCGQTTPLSNNDQPGGSLVQLGEMREARALHTATLLNDGRILIVGGGTPETALATAELYDPVTRSSIVTPLSVGRLGHTATRLADGKVLIVGGGYGSSASSKSAQLFDPVTNRFTETGATLFPRADHAAVLLTDGRVLIVGGDPSGVGSSPLSATELFDPATNSFVRAADLSIPRRPYGVVRLADGRVLVPGGSSTARSVVASAELYDPATDSFVPTGSLGAAREKHTAALLPDGRILIIGGSNERVSPNRLRSTEVYDSRTGQFSAGPAMQAGRHKVVSARLSNGDVLVIGGSDDLAELYRNDLEQFVRVNGTSGYERLFPAAVTLDDGRVLITGGYTAGGSQGTIWAFTKRPN